MSRASKTGVKGLYLDADGRAWIDLRYRDPLTGQRARYKETLPAGIKRAAARDRALEILNLALSGKLATRDRNTPATLAAAFKAYLELAPATSDPKYKERHRDQWLQTLGASSSLEGISEIAIERHKLRRAKEGAAPGTINRELVTIKHFLNRAVEWGWLKRRPKIALLKEPPPRVRWLTDAERTRLAAALDLPQRRAFRRVVAAALLSGQRLGKIITLRRADVDLEHGTLTISDSRKGGRRRTTHVPITAALAAILREALADGPPDPKPGDPVFLTYRSTKGARTPYTRSGVSTFFARVAAEAGLEDFHFHDLRHDFATRVRRGGAGLDVVQALLGHTTPTMTQRYAHLGRDELAAAAARAEGLGVAPPLPRPKESPARNSSKTATNRVRKRAS